MKFHMTSLFKGFSIALTVVAMSTVVSCSKKVSDDDVYTAGADESGAGDSDSGQALGLQTVNYPFDSFVLDNRAKEVLNGNAAILKDRPSVRVQIEGHCDQRGGIQYNIALGEKRADVARKYLIDRGISGDRITTISFGKERPLDPAENEVAYAKNRRANFVITSR